MAPFLSADQDVLQATAFALQSLTSCDVYCCSPDGTLLCRQAQKPVPKDCPALSPERIRPENRLLPCPAACPWRDGCEGVGWVRFQDGEEPLRLMLCCTQAQQFRQLRDRAEELFTLLRLSSDRISEFHSTDQLRRQAADSKAAIGLLIEELSHPAFLLDQQGRILERNRKSLYLPGSDTLEPGSNIRSHLPHLSLQPNLTGSELLWHNQGESWQMFCRVLTPPSASPSLCLLSIAPASLYQSTTDPPRSSFSFSGLIGQSPLFCKMVQNARNAAATDVNLLLLGEEGSGRKTLGEAIHNQSARRSGPFVLMRCAAWSNQREEELFEPGGNLDQAQGGTLYLDNIGELPVTVQLRLVQSLGLTGQDARSRSKTARSVRLMCASHLDITSLTAQDVLCADFYYYLHALPLRVPALRERGEDVLLAARAFAEEICAARGTGKKRLGKRFCRQLLSYSWPLNFLELYQLLEQVCEVSQGDMLTLDDLPAGFVSQSHDPNALLGSNRLTEQTLRSRGLPGVSRQLERQTILRYLKIYGASTKAKQAVAKRLGISLTTLYRRLGERP